MAIVLDGTSGITNDSGYTGDGVSFADSTPANTLVTTSGGNVGIGTSTPAQSLDINRATDSRVRLLVNGTATGQIQAVSGDMRVHALGAIPLTFWTDSGERARIDSSGNLLVGTTSSFNAKLNILTTGGDCITTRPSSNISYSAVSFQNSSGSFVGAVAVSTTNTSYQTSSDYRLKEDIQPMTGALTKVASLKPVTYKWKSDGSDGQGFIAHELQEVVPDCVTGEKDAVDAEGNPQYQGIDTSFLVATLTAAIQELKGINDAQAQIITALTARVEALEGAQA
jgi:hypothetical protein